MPTATGRETTAERERRQKAEDYAAMRAAITDEMRAQAAADAAGAELPTYPAGDRLELRTGRRTIKVDQGELERLALADAITATGREIIAHTMTFGLYAGRQSTVYGLRVR